MLVVNRDPQNASKRPTSCAIFQQSIRNQFYICSTLRDGVEPQSRVLKTVTTERTVAPLDTVRCFFLDTISEGGRSDLFAKEIVQVSELTQEVLTLVMPRILFKFHTAAALSIFSETFAAHLSVNG